MWRFSFPRAHRANNHVVICLSILEIYNDNIHDLLGHRRKVELRQMRNSEGTWEVAGDCTCTGLSGSPSYWHSRSLRGPCTDRILKIVCSRSAKVGLLKTLRIVLRCAVRHLLPLSAGNKTREACMTHSALIA